MKKLNCILLIDDDEDDNFFHQLAIKEAGISDNTTICESAFSALEFLKDNNPELIFLDINMPKMNGWEFLGEYRKIKKAGEKKTVIIMLTTSLNPHDKNRAKDIPELTTFHTKPLSKEMLSEIYEEYFSTVKKDPTDE